MTGEDKQWDLLDGPLFEAVEQGLAYQVKQLLIAGANPNALAGGQMTPLHTAAVHGELEVFRLLLDNSADITAKTVRGKTPLQLAEQNRQEHIVSFIRNLTGTAPRVPVMRALTFKGR
jgi:ankyrin repeat protein